MSLELGLEIVSTEVSSEMWLIHYCTVSEETRFGRAELSDQMQIKVSIEQTDCSSL